MRQHLMYHQPGKVVGGDVPGFEIVGNVHEHLVYGIDMYILRGHEAGIYVIYPGAVLHIFGHPGLCYDIVQLQLRVRRQLPGAEGAAAKAPALQPSPAAGVLRLHLLHHLKKPGTARDAQGLQGGGHRQADGLFRAAAVRNHQVRVQRVQSPLRALHRGVKRLQVYGYVCPLSHYCSPPLFS